MVDRALLFRALHAHFVGFYVLCFVGKVYPWPRNGLLSLGEAFGTSRPNTLACGLRKRPGSFLIGSHYRDSQYGGGRLYLVPTIKHRRGVVDPVCTQRAH